MLPLIVKIILVLFLLFIIFNLARALIQMVREPEDNERPMSYYLGRRLMFSAFVVILLIIALLSGWLHPNHAPY